MMEVPDATLLTADEVYAAVPTLGERATECAKRMALRRLIQRANRRRRDLQQPPLRPIPIGRRQFFAPTFVAELIHSL